MLVEIDRDFYCSGNRYKPNGYCQVGTPSSECTNKRGNCGCCHRKYPTPAQYCEEYGQEYPDDGAVYYRFVPSDPWTLNNFKIAKNQQQQDKRYIDFAIVCSCTPWGKPPDGWRPE